MGLLDSWSWSSPGSGIRLCCCGCRCEISCRFGERKSRAPNRAIDLRIAQVLPISRIVGCALVVEVNPPSRAPESASASPPAIMLWAKSARPSRAVGIALPPNWREHTA